jgi:hypothetical protein
MKWKTREGKEIEVKDMTSSHAENTVLMLMRNNGPHKILESLLYAYEKYSEENKPQEVVLNGDMAQEFNDMQDNIDEDEWMNYFVGY